MALEAIPVLHGLEMTLVTFQTAETLSMTKMALRAFHLGMGGRETLHLCTRFRMTAKTDGTEVFNCPKVYFGRRMGIMTLQTLTGGKMFIFAGIMAIRTGRNHALFPGWMPGMAFRAGKILKMGGPVFRKVLHDLLMTGRAECGIDR